jgi:hypothetical protein
MVDWKWLGWTLVSAAFAASTAVWALRTFLHLTDLVAVRWGGGVFLAALTALAISQVRLSAREREFSRMEGGQQPPGERPPSR